MQEHQEIIYESELGSELIQVLSKKAYSTILVLLDENTKMHCWPLIKPQLESAYKNIHLLEIEAGESSKSLENASRLWTELSDLNIARDAVLINLGGGVVTDFGGFIASIYKRGIDFIHYPTSLLAMVDAAIGGKCGIDFMNFKNQLGVFSFPEKTIINSKFLDTLPDEEVLSAYAEMLKHALIADKTYWGELISASLKELNWDRMIKESLAIKLYLVEKDPLEKGDRKLLNFGHTIGHAIEKVKLEKGDPVSHGFAVAAGMLVEGYISCKHLGLDEEEFNEIEGYILNKYERIEIEEKELESILAAVNQDKKQENSMNRFTLLNAIGKASINHHLQENTIREGLNYYRNIN